jgi:hypothetical protein
MGDTSKFLLLAGVLTSLVLMPAVVSATPKKASRQLYFQGSWGHPISGFTHFRSYGSDELSMGTVRGGGFGYGRFLTDNIEIGVALDIIDLKDDLNHVLAPKCQ